MCGQSITNLKIKNLNGLQATFVFEICFCYPIPAPLVPGPPTKTRLHTPKAVTYHEQPHYCRFMIGHSLGVWNPDSVI